MTDLNPGLGIARPRVLCVVGTRPEAIKMAPVIKALTASGLDAPILATAQHRGMLDQMFACFGLKPSWDLDAMRPNQTLPALTGTLVPALARTIQDSGAAIVLAQGDTTTVFCAALAAFYSGVPFGHVEAGLRSGDLASPFPEEAMRRLSGVLARWHFAPTAGSQAALLREGYPPRHIHMVGNTVIDALLQTASRPDLPWPRGVAPLAPGQRLVLITLHRRENFGAPLQQILGALKVFAQGHPEARLVYPVHPNPQVQGPAHAILGGLPNVDLIEPLDYPELIGLMKACFMACTDSGGIQEEAPALGKPVLVFREVSERPEAVAAGGAQVVGSDPGRFLAAAERLWSDPRAYARMAQPRFPYGDGKAAARIARVLKAALSPTRKPKDPSCEHAIPSR